MCVGDEDHHSLPVASLFLVPIFFNSICRIKSLDVLNIVEKIINCIV